MEEHNSMTENKRETKLGVKTKLVITKTEDFLSILENKDTKHHNSAYGVTAPDRGQQR